VTERTPLRVRCRTPGASTDGVLPVLEPAGLPRLAARVRGADAHPAAGVGRPLTSSGRSSSRPAAAGTASRTRSSRAGAALSRVPWLIPVVCFAGGRVPPLLRRSGRATGAAARVTVARRRRRPRRSGGDGRHVPRRRVSRQCRLVHRPRLRRPPAPAGVLASGGLARPRRRHRRRHVSPRRLPGCPRRPRGMSPGSGHRCRVQESGAAVTG
jgi:hypothetical protein